jgi:rRNA-processing protein FCF1
MSSYIDKIHKLKFEILEKKDFLFRNTVITKRPSTDGIIYLGNPYNWANTNTSVQLDLIKLYKSYFEKINLLLFHANENLKKKILDANVVLTNLIEQRKGTAPASIESAINVFNEKIKIFDEFLDLFTQKSGKVIIIPDTNSLIIQPEPIEYSKLINSKDFVFLIMPTVLSELDKLKMTHRDENFRNKAKSVIKRLKGYRNQGNVLDGVIIDKTILLKMNAKEPDFKNTLGWLDKNNMDDRIIANSLEIQLQNPSDNITLVTADLNLQNKATLASLDFFDTDDL